MDSHDQKRKEGSRKVGNTIPTASEIMREVQQVMTFTQLAKLTEIDLRTLSRIATGDLNPGWENMKKILEAAGMEVVPKGKHRVNLTITSMYDDDGEEDKAELKIQTDGLLERRTGTSCQFEGQSGKYRVVGHILF